MIKVTHKDKNNEDLSDRLVIPYVQGTQKKIRISMKYALYTYKIGKLLCTSVPLLSKLETKHVIYTTHDKYMDSLMLIKYFVQHIQQDTKNKLGKEKQIYSYYMTNHIKSQGMKQILLSRKLIALIRKLQRHLSWLQVPVHMGNSNCSYTVVCYENQQ